jgi:hypothetical protein
MPRGGCFSVRPVTMVSKGANLGPRTTTATFIRASALCRHSNGCSWRQAVTPIARSMPALGLGGLHAWRRRINRAASRVLEPDAGYGGRAVARALP